jgi:PPOX class probable F420-dependent enzyme
MGKASLIYTRPTYKKVVNLKKRPRVSLHFDATATGEDIVVFTGTAQIDASTPPVHQNPDYVKKYRQGLIDLGSSPEQMGEEYSIPIRIKPDKVRGW